MGIGRLAAEVDDVAPVQHPQMRRHAGFEAQLSQDRLADLHDVPPLDGLCAEADQPCAQPIAAAVAQFLDHAVFHKGMDQADQGRAVDPQIARHGGQVPRPLPFADVVQEFQSPLDRGHGVGGLGWRVVHGDLSCHSGPGGLLRTVARGGKLLTAMAFITYV
jgi:hypothetical protein